MEKDWMRGEKKRGYGWRKKGTGKTMKVGSRRVEEKGKEKALKEGR